MPDDKTTIIFRIEKELKTEFEQIAQATERTVSQYLRAFIKDTIQKHRQRNAQEQAPTQPQAAQHTPASNTQKTTNATPKLPKGQKLNRMPPRKTKK